MTRRFRNVILAAAAALAAGCASAPAVRKAGEVYDAQSLVDALENRVRRAPIAGKASVRIEQGKQRQSVSLSFVLVPPNQLRLDASTLFGIPVASAASDGARFSVFQHGDNRYYSVAASSPEARALAGVSLNPAEFIALATGVPPLAGYTPVEGTFEVGKTAYGLVLRDPSGRRLALAVNKDSLLVRELRYRMGSDSLTISYESHRATEAGALPEKVAVATGDGANLQIELGSWRFHPDTDPETFSIPAPPGVKP